MNFCGDEKHMVAARGKDVSRAGSPLLNFHQAKFVSNKNVLSSQPVMTTSNTI